MPTLPNNRDLTQGSIPGHMVRLTGFMMLGVCSFNIASLIETIYIGMVGTNELAAISFTFPVVFMLQGVSMGLAIGASSVVARTIGMGEQQMVKRLSAHCMLIVTVVSVLLGFIAYLWLHAIFDLLGASDEVLPLVVSYMSIWLIGLPVFAMSLCWIDVNACVR